jgi:polysaccharide biosynthesis protein PslJ
MSSLQRIFFNSDRRLAWTAMAALCLAAGLVAGVYVAVLSPIYALAGTLAVAGGLLMLRDTQWGFAALIGIICLLPFGALPFKLGFTPTFLDIALLALYFVWLGRIASGRATGFAGSSLGAPVVIFVLLGCASFVAGLGHAYLDQYVVRHFAELVLSICLFFVVLNTIQTPAQLKTAVKLLILAGFVAALVGIVLYFLPQTISIRLLSSLGRFGYPTGAGVLRFVEDDPGLPQRAISTSTDPNVLGGLLILVTTLTAAQLFTPTPLLPRLLLAGMVLVDCTCLYLTYSRGSMLGLAVGLGVLAVVRYRKLIPVMAVAAVLLLLLPQTQAYVQHLIEGLQQQDLATQMRLGEYKDALLLIGRHPWVGVGFVGTPEASLYIGVSNVYLLMAEEMGMIGLGAFLLILGVFFSQMRRAWVQGDRSGEMAGLTLGLTASVAGMLVGGLLDHYFFNLDFPHSVAVFWLFVGLAMASARLGNQAADLPSWTSRDRIDAQPSLRRKTNGNQDNRNEAL